MTTRLLLATAVVLGISAPPAFAQTAVPAAASAPAPAATSTAAQAAAPAQTPAPAPTHDEHQSSAREYPSLKISGFGDINFARTEHVEGPRGFFEGQLTLHMASELSARTTFF